MQHGYRQLTRYEIPVHEECLAAELTHILECLRTGKDSPNRIEHNYRTDVLVRRTIQSSEEGREVVFCQEETDM